jgi:hypothetical protein
VASVLARARLPAYSRYGSYLILYSYLFELNVVASLEGIWARVYPQPLVVFAFPYDPTSQSIAWGLKLQTVLPHTLTLVTTTTVATDAKNCTGMWSYGPRVQLLHQFGC